MSESVLKTLEAERFFRMIPERERRFEEASGAFPKLDYPANKLAEKLHPGKQFLKVLKVRELAPDCRSFILGPDPEKGTENLAYFDAGQFLSVTVHTAKGLLSRPYTIVSSPKDALRGFYEIAVRYREGGAVSTAVFETWREGTAVEASEPMGFFTYEPLRDSRLLVLASGGSGVTPFVSLARAVKEGTEDAELVIFSGNMTRERAVYQEELAELAEACDRIRFIPVFSDEVYTESESGLITEELIRQYTGDREFTLFVCGPAGLVSSLRNLRETGSLPVRNVRVEENETEIRENGDSCFRLTVHRGKSSAVIPAPAGLTLLRALEEGGIRAPSACRTGSCGFCRARLISGSFETPENLDRRRAADAVYGYVHPCCTYPLSDMEIEIREE